MGLTKPLSQWPLHSGQAFGMTGRILVFLTGLACPVLFVTGMMRWRQKRRAHKLKAPQLGLPSFWRPNS